MLKHIAPLHQSSLSLFLILYGPLISSFLYMFLDVILFSLTNFDTANKLNGNRHFMLEILI